ncbi:MAG: methyltransferase domain-containing protein [Vicinamibacteraceae bacterium]
MNRQVPFPCRSCGAAVTDTVLDLGEQPLANTYRTAEELHLPEPRYPLRVARCRDCSLVQLDQVVPPPVLFSKYAYFSSVSTSWVEHARVFAAGAIKRFGLTDQSLVLEAASNDGYLLQHFIRAGIPARGVEPASNVAQEAIARGVPTDVAFFGLEYARHLVASRRRADLIVGNNVLAHVPALNDFVGGLAAALEPGGTISLEFPHLLRLVEQAAFDTIYHEHTTYLSIIALEPLFDRHRLRLIDAEDLSTHGGSLRVLAVHADDPRDRSPRLAEIAERERAAGLHSVEAHRRFGERVKLSLRSLRTLLDEARRTGLGIAAYGAAAKGNTLLNASGATTRDIPYVVDRSPHKQGRYLPGSGIPIYPPEKLAETKPRYVLVLPWNLLDEIREQNSGIRRWGGRFVTAIPEVRVWD